MTAPCVDSSLRCARMTRDSRHEARALLGGFLERDPHYRATAASYGDGGPEALDRALELFLARPKLGFVWLAHAGGERPVGACVVAYAISTSRGGLVAKLDDVTIDPQWQGRGVGSSMLRALADELRRLGASRIDTACHRDNTEAWRFYERLGFAPLAEERLAWLL